MSLLIVGVAVNILRAIKGRMTKGTVWTALK